MTEASIIGRPINRVDGALTARGRARYSAEYGLAGLLHAVIVPSTIAAGRIVSIDTRAAETASGVRLVLTHRNAPRVRTESLRRGGPDRALSLLQDDAVRHDGEPVALVVADSFEQATHAASLVRVDYAAARPITTTDRSRAAGLTYRPPGWKGLYTRGAVEPALAAAPVKVDLTFTTPIQHHHPMEPHATVAVWADDRLTVYDPHQMMEDARAKLAHVFGVPQANVRAIAKFIGGGFGGKGSVWSHTALAAMAARRLERPVKLVLSRPQMATSVGYRATTRQRVALGADRAGRLVATVHETVSNISRFDEWAEYAGQHTPMLYACPTMRTSQELVPLDLGTPTFMRAPGEAMGSFALECAMDALAYELAMDPVALRLANYAETDPQSGKPWSSKELRQCYARGAERFGWSRRPVVPGSRRENGLLVGYGMATATYPARRSLNAAARVRIYGDGTVLAECATTDLGTGTLTVMTQVIADTLGVPFDRVRFDLGDSDFPVGGPSGGSAGACSTSAALHAVCLRLRRQLFDMAAADPQSPLHGLPADMIEASDGVMRARGEPARHDSYQAVLTRAGVTADHPLRHHAELSAEGEGQYGSEDWSYHAFGAQFAEVRVDPDFGTVRVARQLGAFAVGRVLNEKTATSQLMGGMIWGLGAALLEGTRLDTRSGRYTTRDLSQYLVPVNADIGEIDVLFVDEHDPHVSSLGVKGVGELGITGATAAIVNAVFNATGRRITDLPIMPERLI